MKFIYLLLLTCSLNAVFAQKNQTLIYLNAKNTEVKTFEEAEYTRTIALVADNLYRLLEQYKNGDIRREGNLNAVEPVFKYVDQLISYYKNGNKQSIFNYNQKNKLEGDAYLFYSNGNLKERRVSRN